MSYASRGITAALLLLLMVSSLYGGTDDTMDRAVTALSHLFR